MFRKKNDGTSSEDKKASRSRNRVGGVEAKFIKEQAKKRNRTEEEAAPAVAPVVAAAPAESKKKKSSNDRKVGKAEFRLNQEQIERMIRESQAGLATPAMVRVTKHHCASEDDKAEDINPAIAQDNEVTPDLTTPTAALFVENSMVAAEPAITTTAKPEAMSAPVYQPSAANAVTTIQLPTDGLYDELVSLIEAPVSAFDDFMRQYNALAFPELNMDADFLADLSFEDEEHRKNAPAATSVATKHAAPTDEEAALLKDDRFFILHIISRLPPPSLADAHECDQEPAAEAAQAAVDNAAQAGDTGSARRSSRLSALRVNALHGRYQHLDLSEDEEIPDEANITKKHKSGK